MQEIYAALNHVHMEVRTHVHQGDKTMRTLAFFAVDGAKNRPPLELPIVLWPPFIPAPIIGIIQLSRFVIIFNTTGDLHLRHLSTELQLYSQHSLKR